MARGGTCNACARRASARGASIVRWPNSARHNTEPSFRVKTGIAGVSPTFSDYLTPIKAWTLCMRSTQFITWRHVNNRDQAIREVHRILKPGGLFFLHEVNTDNLILSIYMNHVFPRIRKIDDGEENWILPEQTDKWFGLDRVKLTRFTFVPDFTPPSLFAMFRWLEGWLERSPMRNYAAHFLAVLRRSD